MNKQNKPFRWARHLIALAVVLAALPAAASEESFGVCNRELDKVLSNIDTDYEQWVNAVQDMPAEVRDAYLKVFAYNRNQAVASAQKGKHECYAAFRPLQDIVDETVAVYTGGLSKLLPDKTTRADVSEILNGKPLGGPNAAIPKFRDQVFKALGVNPKSPGAIGSIVIDPWRVLTGKRRL